MLPPDQIHSQPEQTIPTVKKPRKGKITGTLLAAGAAAIVSVYSIGYINTEADTSEPFQAVAPVATATIAPPATATPSTAQVPGTTRQRPGAAATATPMPSTNSGTAQTVGYKDGTYVGSGTSRHGGMQVTVVISGGKITSAAVTTCQTRYPCSDVASLVTAVVSQQAVPANHVSGATDSSNAYKQAVSSALSQARSVA